jgi:leucyl aminopeptidase (aminopeptidase T)
MAYGSADADVLPGARNAVDTCLAVRAGELAFANLGLREMIGVLLQDEEVPGVHIAFGDPYGSQTHANWASRTHVDVLTRDCDVWMDDEQVMADGRCLLDRFDVGAGSAAARRQGME